MNTPLGSPLGEFLCVSYAVQHVSRLAHVFLQLARERDRRRHHRLHVVDRERLLGVKSMHESLRSGRDDELDLQKLARTGNQGCTVRALIEFTQLINALTTTWGIVHVVRDVEIIHS